jgi:hypothetical protein
MSDDIESTADNGTPRESIQIFAIPNRRISTCPDTRIFSRYRPAVFRLIWAVLTISVILISYGFFFRISFKSAVIYFRRTILVFFIGLSGYNNSVYSNSGTENEGP